MEWLWVTMVLSFAVGPPYTLRLKVKFYSSEPNTLREELTRYQFFLQLKQDVLEGKLHCPHQITVQLCALTLQCKYFSYFKYKEIRSISIDVNMIISIANSRARRLRPHGPHSSHGLGIPLRARSNRTTGTGNPGGV